MKISEQTIDAMWNNIEHNYYMTVKDVIWDFLWGNYYTIEDSTDRGTRGADEGEDCMKYHDNTFYMLVLLSEGESIT